MFCRNCGRQLPDGMAFCPQCGAAQAKQGYVYTGEPKPSVSFFEAIKLYFMNYANFSGRSRRITAMMMLPYREAVRIFCMVIPPDSCQ